ncbi:MAG: hypothetical protein FWD59_04825 [Micrococcales bacterium]|nr:hypothetical protein [Micrococcales bacterium]
MSRLCSRLLGSVVLTSALVMTMATAAPGHSATVSVARVAESKSKGAATIVGKVLDYRGKAVKSGFVEVWDAKGRRNREGAPLATGPISSKGTYRIPGLKPNAVYFVGAAAPGHMLTWVSGQIANHPVQLSESKVAIRTSSWTATTTVPTIKLYRGGVTISGKIAGHRKRDRVTAVACTDYGQMGGDQFQWRAHDAVYCYRGRVSPNGSYVIPGVAPLPAEVSVRSAVAQRIAVLDLSKAMKESSNPALYRGTGKKTHNFAPLARSKGPKFGVPTVAIRGHYAPGFTLRAVIEAPFVSNPAAITVVWIDPWGVVGRGDTLTITDKMLGHEVQAIIVASTPDRDIVSWRAADVGFIGLPEIDSLPIPGLINEAGRPFPFSNLDLETRTPWGSTYSVEGPPPGWNYQYQWQCGDDPIPGATSETYTTSQANTGCGLNLELNITGPNGAKGSREIAYPYFVITRRAIDTRATSIEGTATIGSTLKVSSPPPDEFAPTYQWLRNGKAIPSATGLTYRLSAKDSGRVVTVLLKAKAKGYRDLTTEIGRVLVGQVEPKLTAKMPTGASSALDRVKIPVTVRLPHDPLSRTKGLAGTIKVKVAKKSVTKPIKSSHKGKVIVTLPKLPRGNHTVTVTFIPKDKNVAKATFKPQEKLTVR